MTRIKRLLKLTGLALVALVYVWVAAVRAVPGVSRRKADARAARRGKTRSERS